MPSLLLSLTIGVAVIGIAITQFVDMDTVMMRFFRDVARNKARKRLYGDNQHALIPMLFGTEEMIEIPSHDENDESATTMTREELQYYRGQEEGRPLYLSIQNRIYDVSKGAKFYGPDKHYHLFVGTDASRAFATGCAKPECVSSDTTGLSEKEMKEIQRWIELYETHDKYTFIGYLVDDPVEAILEMDEQKENEEAASDAVNESDASITTEALREAEEASAKTTDNSEATDSST